MAVVRRIRCAVREIIDHGERVYSVELEPSIAVPRFKPGQFLHLALDPYDDGFWPESRVFSIASSPDERDRLRITYAVKGAFTTRMERELRAGGNVWVKLPYGEFVIDPDRDAVLFAGGTGVTAFAAFLQSLTPDQRLTGRAVLRRPDAGPVRLSARLRMPVPARFRRCRAGTSARRRTGGCRSTARGHHVQRLDDPVFYLSGPPPMLGALTDQLRGRGVPEADIRTDAWE